MTAPELSPHLRPLSAKVEALAGFGFKPADIALLVHVDLEEVLRTYPHELNSGALKANARIIESLFRKATGEGREAVTAAIFWLKARADWKERSVSEVVHSAENPLALLMQRIAVQGRPIHDGRNLGSRDTHGGKSDAS